MPWTPKDAPRFTKKAQTPKASRQWSHVADSMLASGASEASAIKAANSVVARRNSNSQVSSPMKNAKTKR